MSSVTSADRGRQTDELRSQREDYENREAEEAKRHRKELKRLAEKNDQDTEKLKQNYEQEISDIRNRSNDAITERDQANQAKIDQLRNMYLQQVRQKSDDVDSKRQENDNALKDQLKKERVANEQQKNLLKTNLENEISEHDRAYQDMATRSRDEMRNSLNKTESRLNQAHGKEMQALTEDRDREMAAKDHEVREARASYTDRSKDLERQKDYQVSQVDNNWRNAYNQQEAKTSEILKGNAQELKLAQDHVRDRYDQTLQKKLNALDDAHRILKEQSENRIENQVRSAKSENQRLKNQNLVDSMSQKRINDLERSHLVENYEDRFQQLNEQKQGLVQNNLDRTSDNMQKVKDQAEHLISDADRKHHMEQITTKEQNQEHLAQLQIANQERVDHVSNRSENRVNRLMKSTTQAQIAEQKQHEANVGALKDSYQDRLALQREAQMDQLKDTYLRMDKRVKDIQDKDTKNLEATVNNYEDKIAKTKEFYEGELKKQQDAFNSRTVATTKAHQTEEKSSEMKFDAKIAQLQAEHDKEIDRLEKRHQEQMATLDTRLSYYRKKS